MECNHHVSLPLTTQGVVAWTVVSRSKSQSCCSHGLCGGRRYETRRLQRGKGVIFREDREGHDT